MQANIRKRFLILFFSLFTLFITGWLELFFQKRQDLIGAGINRAFLFLLINAYFIVSIILLYLIIRQCIKLFTERKKEVPGSAFKRNLFFAFIVFSVLPVVFVFFVAGKLITTGIDNWFQARLGEGLKNGLYLHEQQTRVDRDNILKAGSLVKSKFSNFELFKDRENLREDIFNGFDQEKKIYPFLDQYRFYVWEKNGKELCGSISDEVNVWRAYRKVNDRTTKSLRIDFFNKFQSKDFSEKVFDFYGSLYWVHKVFYSSEKKNIFFILVYRYPETIRYALMELQMSIVDYLQLKSMRNPIYWNYLLTFLLVTLLILFLSIWCAFYLAKGISRPIQQLLLAIEKIRKGNWNVRVSYSPTDDLRHLVIGFNEMTSTLQQAYSQLEFHNKEMLTIWEHIKESVFFINNFGRILMFNEAAKRLVEKYLKVTRFKSKKINFLGEFVKQSFFSLVKELKHSGKTNLTKEISFSFNTEVKTFMVYLSINAMLKRKSGILVIIEDLTEVYKINKIKTWQEAAKQMAHEIKNPLTPIQLATQRLQRKLRKNVLDQSVLMECADTILHQVKIIKDLVAHFSEFAKMPGNIIEPLDVNNVIKEVVHIYETSYPDVYFIYDFQEYIPVLKMDKKRLKRLIVNLIDNSIKALKSNPFEKKLTRDIDVSNEKIITIKTDFKTSRNQIELIISDNGPGISREVRERLFLPYVSSSSKSMGLGLAIVHDIVLQAGGSIKLLDSSQGAMFQILLPV